MKKFLAGITLFIFFCLKFYSGISQTQTNSYPWIKSKNIQQTIETRFPPPTGYERVKAPPGSFGDWLRGLPLLPDSTPVKEYRGRIMVQANDTTLAAVVNYDIFNKKLEQCMDIIIRLRAEYLRFKNKKEISFFLPVKFLLNWADWARGYRPVFQGINISLVQQEIPDSSRAAYEKYLREIFYYSGTQTAYFNYSKIEPGDVQIGDFIVKKGKKGHTILIIDLVVNSQGEKMALIGHGDTPACQFYVLNYRKGQPWFPLNVRVKRLPMPFKKKMYWDGLRRF